MYSCSRYITPVARMAVSSSLLQSVLHPCKSLLALRCSVVLLLTLVHGRLSDAGVAGKPSSVQKVMVHSNS